MAVGAPKSPAASSTAMPLIGGGWLPLAFFGVGLISLATGAGILASNAEWLQWPHFHPSLVGVAHLWLPGGLGAICIGACYQMAPVVLGTPLRARRGAVWWHLALHSLGLIALVVAFFAGSYKAAAIAGSAVALGTALLHGTLARTFCRSTRRDAAAWSLPIATGWLALTACSGAVLAWNRQAPFLPLDVIALLRAHAHAGVVGFFGGLLQGVTFQLAPMFTMAEVRRPRLAIVGLLSAQVGLLMLIIGLAGGGSGLARVGGTVLLGAFLCSAEALRATLATRRRRHWEIPLLNFLGGIALAAIGTLAGLALLLGSYGDEVRLRGTLAYGLLIIAGALPLMILGMLGKILPFLVWMKAYGPKVGRQTVPQTNQLGRPRWERGWGAAHTVAVGILAVGAFTGHGTALTLGTVTLVAALGLYVVHVAAILRHLWHPVRPTPAVPTPPSPHALARSH